MGIGQMKTEEQIQHARSVLAVTALIMERAAENQDEVSIAVANTAINVLAWVLDEDEEFDQKLGELETGLKQGIAECMSAKN